MNTRITELENLITVALEQRKQANKLNLRLLTKSLNADLRSWRFELLEIKAGA